MYSKKTMVIWQILLACKLSWHAGKSEDVEATVDILAKKHRVKVAISRQTGKTFFFFTCVSAESHQVVRKDIMLVYCCIFALQYLATWSCQVGVFPSKKLQNG